MQKFKKEKRSSLIKKYFWTFYLIIVVGFIGFCFNVIAQPPMFVPGPASTSIVGIVELATDAETVTGTSDAVVTTPGNITAKMSAPGAIGDTTPAAGTFTDIRATASIRGSTSLWWHAYCVDAASVSPGGSGASWLAADANHLEGYQLDAANEYLYLTACLHSDWDAASDPEIKVTFEIMGAGTGADDKERIIAQCYYKGHDGAVGTKTQSPYGDVTINDDAQYTLYTATITIDHDLAANVVNVGDKMSIRINLDTANSDVDDILISHINFRYRTAKMLPEV